MNKTALLLFKVSFLFLIITSVFYGCGGGSTAISSHCSDNIYNSGEEGLDCGGTCNNECSFTEKNGELTDDETWSGNIYVSGSITVPEGITLTILPGTIVKFKERGDYKEFAFTSIAVNGGTIKAVGTADERIWFTSNAETPMNGDWSGINISNSDDSEFEYIILEFSGMGIEQYYSNVYIANSIIRWVNIEGVYSEHSTSTFENNTFYSNGYHEIALEQFNTDMVIQNNIFEDGHEGIAIFDTSATVTGNYFTDYEGSAIVVAGSTDATITQNKFNNITAEEISQPGGDEVTVEENDFGDDSIEIPMMDYDIITNHTLSYIPASTDDQFPYVYDTEDETREVTKRIGAGLGFGWTLTYADGYLYKMDGGTIYKIDPDTEDYDTITTTDPLLTASSALTYDGTHFWIVNTSLNKIVEFSITGNTATVESSFDAGSTAVRIAGLTTDGTYLYYVSSNKMTKLEKSGNVVTETSFDPGTAADGLIVWTGQDFWGSGGYKGLIRFDATGKVLGTVYPPAFGMTEVAWDGQNLWVLAKTCERWNDAKIFKLKILDDSVPGD